MNRGELFEHQFIASLPASVWRRKLTTPAPPAHRNGAILGMLQRLAAQARETVPGWALASLSRTSHTPQQPFDLLISARAPVIGDPTPCASVSGADGIEALYLVHHRIDFALELKSTGSAMSLPFDRVKPHQIRGLQKARAAGLVAGLVVEFPDVAEGGEVFFIPVEVLVAHIETCGRKSLSIDAARRFGVLIELDPERGTKHRYWKVGEFLARFGADVV